MALVPSPKALQELKSFYALDEPVMFQEFIQHDGVLIKVYVADGEPYIFIRPSLKNIMNGKEEGLFDLFVVTDWR